MSRSEKCREVMRRRWAGRWEYWRDVVERQQASGLNITAFCAREDVPASSFHSWRNKLGMAPKQAAPARRDFIEITVAPVAQNSGVSLEVGAVRIHVQPGFEESTLGNVLKVLRDLDG